MKTFVYIILAFFLAAGCATQKTLTSFSDWDANADERIDRREFVNAYEKTSLFNHWSDSKGSITKDEMYDGIFTALDSDSDNKISIIEFRSRIEPYFFGVTNERFKSWDKNNNASIDREEFFNSINDTNLTDLWDTSHNGRISKDELAGGMFYMCDKDNNRKVDPIEFNEWRTNR